MNQTQSSLNEEVRNYWEKEPCETSPSIIGDIPKNTIEYFQSIEEYRYNREPFIHSTAQFTRWHGKKILEIGVGAGTDHLQWARAGCECYGVDLTEAAIETTRTHLAIYGLNSELQQIDAEKLPFADESFDLVYSWGVIHHSECPERIIGEIKRVLKPDGIFIGMMYGMHSLVAFKMWVKYALLKGKPWRSFSDVIWHHVESVGTKAYTVSELKKFFREFSNFTADPILTSYDTDKWPDWLSVYFPKAWGWFICLRAVK
jgi:ubiquinone/menaquinone biosynthesis C-methylase UbiE